MSLPVVATTDLAGRPVVAPVVSHPGAAAASVLANHAQVARGQCMAAEQGARTADNAVAITGMRTAAAINNDHVAGAAHAASVVRSSALNTETAMRHANLANANTANVHAAAVHTDAVHGANAAAIRAASTDREVTVNTIRHHVQETEIANKYAIASNEHTRAVIAGSHAAHASNQEVVATTATDDANAAVIAAKARLAEVEQLAATSENRRAIVANESAAASAFARDAIQREKAAQMALLTANRETEEANAMAAAARANVNAAITAARNCAAGQAIANAQANSALNVQRLQQASAADAQAALAMSGQVGAQTAAGLGASKVRNASARAEFAASQQHELHARVHLDHSRQFATTAHVDASRAEVDLSRAKAVEAQAGVVKTAAAEVVNAESANYAFTTTRAQAAHSEHQVARANETAAVTTAVHAAALAGSPTIISPPTRLLRLN